MDGFSPKPWVIIGFDCLDTHPHVFFLMFLQTSTKMGMQHFCEDGELLQKFWIYSNLPNANWENDS